MNSQINTPSSIKLAQNLKIVQMAIYASSALLFVFGGYFYFDNRQFLEKAQTTQGTFKELSSKKVTSNNQTKTVYQSRMEFTDENGATQSEWLNGNYSKAASNIELLYNPNHTPKIQDKSNFSPWLIPTVLILVGFVEIAFMAPFIINIMKKKHSTTLTSNGSSKISS